MATTTTSTVRHTRRVALAGLALMAVAAGLIATPTATAPDLMPDPVPRPVASAPVTITLTPARRLTKRARVFWTHTPTTARVIVDAARLRSSPAPDGLILGLIPSGAAISVRCTDLGRDRDLWGDATYRGLRGWVHTSLWRPTAPTHRVPRCGAR